METSPILSLKILQVLARRYGMSCTLEELTKLVTLLCNASASVTASLSIERENQARVLDALLLLNDEGYLFLNSYNDRSSVETNIFSLKQKQTHMDGH